MGETAYDDWKRILDVDLNGDTSPPSTGSYVTGTAISVDGGYTAR